VRAGGFGAGGGARPLTLFFLFLARLRCGFRTPRPWVYADAACARVWGSGRAAVLWVG